VYGATLTAITTSLTSTPGGTLGTLTYQWQRGSENIGNSATYILVSADNGATITVTVTAANCSGSVTSAATAPVANQNQAAPGDFTLQYTANGVTNYTVTIPTTAGAEYSFDGVTYAVTNTRTANPGTTVTGYKRLAARPGYNASTAVSDSVTLPLIPAAPSGDATLAALSLSTGTLVPAFSPTISSYTASVPNSVSSVTVSAVKNNANASVVGTGAQALQVGTNYIAITVTAANGTKKTYTVAVTRATSSGSGGGGSGGGGSGGGSRGGSGGGGGGSVITPEPTPTIKAPTKAPTSEQITYISGANRSETAIAISQKGWPNGADTVFLAPSQNQNLIDSLGLAPLAGQLDAPTLLNSGTVVAPAVLAEIRRLAATKIIITGAISPEIAAQLRAALPGVNLDIVNGMDRYATIALLNARITEPKGVFLIGYNAVADAVSIASWAAANSYIIQLANPDGSWQCPTAYVGLPGYIIGGPTLVQDNSGFPRLAGADRYETNRIIRTTLTFSSEIVYTADGNTLVDALAGAVLAARSNSPIVLTPGGDISGIDFGNITETTEFFSFGGSK
jgi:hypothetical protein